MNKRDQLIKEIEEYEELLEDAEYGSSEYDFYDSELQYLTVQLERLENNE